MAAVFVIAFKYNVAKATLTPFLVVFLLRLRSLYAGLVTSTSACTDMTLYNIIVWTCYKNP